MWIILLTMTRLANYYEKIVRKDMLDKYEYTNAHQIPHIEKITLNVSFKKAVMSRQAIIPVLLGLEIITGQRAKVTRAKKSIAGFKVREGMIVGCMVTLRGLPMYDFLDRLVTLVLPRHRDFNGLSISNLDGRGNCNFGLSEFVLFPEIEQDYDKFEQLRGMDIAITTSTCHDQEALALLSGLLLPFGPK